MTQPLSPKPTKPDRKYAPDSKIARQMLTQLNRNAKNNEQHQAVVETEFWYLRSLIVVLLLVIFIIHIQIIAPLVVLNNVTHFYLNYLSLQHLF